MSATLTAAFSVAVLAQAASSQAATLEADASTPFTVGFANEATTAPFQINVQNSMEAGAKADGDKLISLNNNYDDATALRNAQILANDKVDVAVEFQVDSKIAPAIAQTFKKAGIKWTISIDIPQPGAIFFGANNYADGNCSPANTPVPTPRPTAGSPRKPMKSCSTCLPPVLFLSSG